MMDGVEILILIAFGATLWATSASFMSDMSSSKLPPQLTDDEEESIDEILAKEEADRLRYHEAILQARAEAAAKTASTQSTSEDPAHAPSSGGGQVPD